jgi:hypothetical protein
MAVASSAHSASIAATGPNAARALASDAARVDHALRAGSGAPNAQNSCASARAAGGYRSRPAPARNRSNTSRIAAASWSCTPRS